MIYPEQSTSVINPDRFGLEQFLAIPGFVIVIKLGQTVLRGERFLEQGESSKEWNIHKWAVFYPEEIETDEEWECVKSMIWTDKFHTLNEKWANFTVQFFHTSKATDNRYLDTWELFNYNRRDRIYTRVEAFAKQDPEAAKQLGFDALVEETHKKEEEINKFCESLQTKRRKLA